MARNSTVLDTKVLDKIIKNLPGNTRDGVAKVAFTVEAKTKLNIQQMEAIDTGALVNSVYTSLKQGGNGDAAMAAARGRNPDAVITPLPRPTNDYTAYVGPSVEYAEEVHFGAHNMAGRPYLAKAITDTARTFAEVMGEAVVHGK